MLVYIFLLLGLACLAMFFLSKKAPHQKAQVKQEAKVEQKKSLGDLQVFYASQTGTASKMASTFAQEASEYGFNGIAISLKDITHQQFQKNQISVFFMANTGEGDPPENAIAFMKIIGGKLELEGRVPEWKNMNYTVFGLGDTQYQHFNKVGIDTDKGLQALGATRIHPIGLGDANASMQDDYNEWKAQLWPKLVKFREQNPYEHETAVRKISSHFEETQEVEFLSSEHPQLANYRFCILKQDRKPIIVEQQLDFKTKASLLSQPGVIQKIQEKRQNNEGGSSLEIVVHLRHDPEYETASNIALWPTNDPAIVSEVLAYFKLDPKKVVDVKIINKQKTTKFNFVTPITIQKLLEEYIDLQFRITKGLLKKLSKFESKNSAYFLDNSSAKTTQEYKRLSDGEFMYLFKLVKQYQVKLSFQDFVELSDSMGPRLFTIASSWRAKKKVHIVASIAQNGLISKAFLRSPERMKAELRKSTFTRIDHWKKVIFVGAGTGLAPYIGYLQDKQIAVQEGKPFPLVSLYFGCRKSNSDFIYKQQLLKWQKEGLINRLSLAFSRETVEKVYVQNLLQKAQDQVQEFINDHETALFICGSLAMGKDVMAVLQKSYEKTPEQFKKVSGEWEKSGKLIKQLW